MPNPPQEWNGHDKMDFSNPDLRLSIGIMVSIGPLSAISHFFLGGRTTGFFCLFRGEKPASADLTEAVGHLQVFTSF
jgi:hypothetical protein